MGYTKGQIINACSNEANKDIRTLYKADFINYKGKTEDTNEYYTEIVSEWLLEHLELLQKIPVVSRTSGYRVLSHNGIIKNANSNRTEEIIAMKMFQQSTISGLGKIIDYQTPLKNTSSDPVGKIDLLSYDGNILRLLELKKPDSQETMLRCVVEGYTYSKTIDKKILKDSFSDILSKDTTIKVNPFVFVSSKSNPYLEMKDCRPMLRKLIDVLDCKPLYIKDENGIYTVTEEIEWKI